MADAENNSLLPKIEGRRTYRLVTHKATSAFAIHHARVGRLVWVSIHFVMFGECYTEIRLMVGMPGGGSQIHGAFRILV